MYRNLLALTAILAMLAAAFDAGAAACTAGNPNAALIESTPTSAFTDHGDGTVTHNLTGLMWKQCAQGSSGASCATGTAIAVDWKTALAAAVADTTGGHSDWRVPNKKEIESIVETCGYNPAINQTVFPAVSAAFSPFWSGTTSVQATGEAWYVDFGAGITYLFFKTFSNYGVRLVRGGQPFDSFDAQHPTTTVPVLQSVGSRKAHGAAGIFNLALSMVATAPTTEPRQGPAQTIVFTFDKPINAATANVTEGAATAATPIFSGNDAIVVLTGVNNQQYVTIALTNVASVDGATGGSGSVRVGFLLGDVNQNRVVTLADLGLMNAQLAQSVTAANFLKDVNASGTLTLADKGITNANLTKALPPP